MRNGCRCVIHITLKNDESSVILPPAVMFDVIIFPHVA
uniref:Uncharacterized protein n=1 Tax=Anguilla anguilla TaxID=7936 RepID=A0A0E9TDG2_ANGAN